ncbi:MAG: DUF2849 domain-containing protein [Parvularculales bacterium]
MVQHASKHVHLQMVTANRLRDGEVVYLTSEGTWTEVLEEGAVSKGRDEGEALLARAMPSVEAREVVEPYLFAVVEQNGCFVPVSVREQIRMAGPTTRLDLGKQARE